MTKLYDVIVTDPPWAYGPARHDDKEYKVVKKQQGLGGEYSVSEWWSRTNSRGQYRTMSVEQLMEMKLPAADNCLLYMWIPNLFLVDGSGARLCRQWGFQPKNLISWVKFADDFGDAPSTSVGHWYRSASEHVLFGIKGTGIKRPPGYPVLPTFFSTRRLEHSVKPDTIHRWAEMAVPKGRYLEVFARRARPGWDLFGNQAPEQTAQGVSSPVDGGRSKAVVQRRRVR